MTQWLMKVMLKVLIWVIEGLDWTLTVGMVRSNQWIVLHRDFTCQVFISVIYPFSFLYGLTVGYFCN